MTAAPQPGKSDNPEQRRTKVEQVLHSAASWTPDSSPTDFVARAMQQNAGKTKATTARRKPNQPRGVWWGFGTVGVAAASVVFTMTGKIPQLESNLPSPSPTLVRNAGTAPAPTQRVGFAETVARSETATSGKGNTNSKGTLAKVPSPVAEEQSAPVIHRGRRSSYRTSGRRFAATATESGAHSARTTQPSPTVTPKTSGEKIASRTTATPAPEIYATDDGRILVPMVVAHTSEDGTEVSYTPTVVEMAYQPVSDASHP